MYRLSFLKLRTRFGVGLALAAAVAYVASTALVTGADTKTEKTAKTDKSDTDFDADSKADSKKEKKGKSEKKKKKLTGAELYAINCNRCHPERYPTEFTAAQWKTIMTHMRVRANLPAEQAKTILKYLQEDSGTP